MFASPGLKNNFVPKCPASGSSLGRLVLGTSRRNECHAATTTATTQGSGQAAQHSLPLSTLHFHRLPPHNCPFYPARLLIFRSADTLYSGCASSKSFTSPRACIQPVGIKEGKRSSDPRHFLRVGEGIEARRKAGKRPESLPKLGHYGGGGRRTKGAAGTERGSQPLPAR